MNFNNYKNMTIEEIEKHYGINFNGFNEFKTEDPMEYYEECDESEGCDEVRKDDIPDFLPEEYDEDENNEIDLVDILVNSETFASRNFSANFGGDFLDTFAQSIEDGERWDDGCEVISMTVWDIVFDVTITTNEDGQVEVSIDEYIDPTTDTDTETDNEEFTYTTNNEQNINLLTKTSTVVFGDTEEERIIEEPSVDELIDIEVDRMMNWVQEPTTDSDISDDEAEEPTNDRTSLFPNTRAIFTPEPFRPIPNIHIYSQMQEPTTDSDTDWTD